MADPTPPPPNDPKLHFANETGVYIEEYIPTDNFMLGDWLRDRHIAIRDYFGKDIHYWHVRHRLIPRARKTTDIEFLQHVITDHGLEPEDRLEKRYFDRAWGLYGHEYRYILAEISKDSKNDPDDPGPRLGHPYAYAYMDHWFEKSPEIEIKLLYHGVSYSQYFSLLDLLEARGLQRRAAHREKHGLDPETGKKPDTVAEPDTMEKPEASSPKKPGPTKRPAADTKKK